MARQREESAIGVPDYAAPLFRLFIDGKAPVAAATLADFYPALTLQLPGDQSIHEAVAQQQYVVRATGQGGAFLLPVSTAVSPAHRTRSLSSVRKARADERRRPR